MAKKSKPVEEYTVEELISTIEARVPTMVVGVIVPEDGNVCETVMYTSGNKATCLGLAVALKEYCLDKMLDNATIQDITEAPDEEEEEDEPPHRNHG